MTQSLPIFDSHLHIIDPRFPLFENQGYIPAPFSVENYLHATSNYELLGGTVVSGSFQKQNQSYLLDALEKLGKRFVGVTQLLHTCSDEDVALLNEAGVRAVRFNLKRGGSEGIKQLKNFALRLHDLAEWHVELYVDSTELEGLSPTLLSLPKVSIDHLGLSKVGIKSLLKCAEKGVHIKATGFGRIDFKPASVIQDLYKANPHCLMFGTDLPSTRAPRAFQHNDIQLIVDNLDAEAAERVLWKNALTLYKPAI